jgi:hypothetical protein
MEGALCLDDLLCGLLNEFVFLQGDSTIERSVSVPSDFGEGYDEKYVLLEVTRKKTSRFWVVSRRLRFHSNIVHEFESTVLGEEDDAWRLSVVVHGGGILRVKHGTIETYGSSGGYGMVTKLDEVKKVRQKSALYSSF